MRAIRMVRRGQLDLESLDAILSLSATETVSPRALGLTGQEREYYNREGRWRVSISTILSVTTVNDLYNSMFKCSVSDSVDVLGESKNM